MDATNQKKLAWGFTALMLGSLFAGIAVAPTAAAQTGSNPTSAPDVIVNATQRRTENFNVDVADGPESEADVSIVTTPSGGSIEADTTYDFTVEGLDIAAGGYGYLSGVTTVYLVNRSSGAAISGGVATVYSTGGDWRAATFPGISFPGPGVYEVRTSSPTGTLVARVFVQPNNDITVTISPSSFPWTASGATYTITVTGASGGIEGVRLSGANIPSGTTTLSGGTRTIVGPLPGAGVFTIEAEIFRCTGGDPAQCTNANSQTFGGDRLPHVRNNATLTVTGGALNMTTVATTAFVGFQNTIQFRPSFTDTNENVGQLVSGNLRTELRQATDYINVSVVTPGNVLIVANISNPNTMSGTVDLAAIARCRDLSLAADDTAGAFDARKLVACNTASAGLQASHGNVVPRVWTLDTATGIISFAPGENTATLTDVWAAGTYTFTVGANTEGALATPPEYSGTLGITPATPAAVNLEFTSNVVDETNANVGEQADGTNRDAAAGTLDVLGAKNPTSGTPVLKSYTLSVVISGQASAEHPQCRYQRTAVESVVAESGQAAGSAAIGTCAPGDDVGTRQSAGVLAAAETGATSSFRGNVTLRGDLLPGWTVSSYVPSTGVATITGVKPTRNGTIWLDVAWKNVTTTLAIPVIRGANVTADLVNMTVDASNVLTVTVRAATGGAEPSAYVRLFQRDANGGAFVGTGTSEITGTNEAGRGLNGAYTFTVNPSQVQDLVVYAQVGSGASQNYSYFKLDVLPNQATNITLNTTQTMASLKTQFTLNASNATHGFAVPTTNFRVYFLTAADRLDLVNNGTTSLFDGTPAIGTCGASAAIASCLVTVDATSASGTVFNVTLQTGDWYLYFCSGFASGGDCTTATRDNRQNMLVINATAYTATLNPAQIASSADIQQNTVVNIRVNDRNGNPANGTVTLGRGSTLVTGGTSATITNGQGNITLTGTSVGTVNLLFDPTDAGSQVAQSSELIGNLSVIAGNLTFNPTRVPILQSTLVTVRLANFTGAGLGGRVIRLCGTALNGNWPAAPATNNNPPATLAGNDITNCPAVGTTESDGSTGIVVTPTGLNPIHVYVNNSWTQRTIPVTAGTLVVTVNPTSPQQGGNATFTVTQPGGVASVGARVLVTRDGTTVLDATADGNGQATITNLATGNYTVTAIRTGYDNGTASFRIGAAPVNETARFELRNLVLPDTVNVGTPVTVRVTVANTGTASGTANAILLVNNIQRGSQNVTLAPGQNQTVEYTFSATVAGTYAVVVRIGDTTIGPNNIVVGTPAVTPTATPTTGVTPSPTGTTPTPVTPTRVTPTSAATPTPTGPATTTPTPTPTPTVGGFEVIVLLGALAVAMTVLRRRK